MQQFKSFIVSQRIKLTWLLCSFFFFFFLFSTSSRHHRLYDVLEICGYILMILATLGRLWCGVYISGRKNKELCQLGPYSISRNPLYFFSFIGAVGVALGTQNIILVLIIVPMFWIYYRVVIASEEATLKQLFGADFEKYKQTTSQFIPRWRDYKAATEITVKTSSLMRAIMDAMAFMWILVVLELIHMLKEISWMPVYWHLPF
jgi:protein-S-isoprenylcysteine O-methyltransferase Ste14